MTQQHWHQLATHTPLGILTDLDGMLIPVADTKGALLERKSFSVALHDRQVRTVEREELKIEADS